MQGIVLKESIKQFGFKFGFSFWFRWSFLDPIKEFIWTYVTKHPLCLEHGLFWKCPENCMAIKLTKRRDKIKYQKERRKKIDIEAKTIRVGPDGECVYCGEELGTEIINDPNWDTLERWKVCESCKEVIEIQRELNFLFISKIDSPEKAVKLNERLLEISKLTGKQIVGCVIEKQNGGSYKSSSITFEGGFTK